MFVIELIHEHIYFLYRLILFKSEVIYEKNYFNSFIDFHTNTPIDTNNDTHNDKHTHAITHTK